MPEDEQSDFASYNLKFAPASDGGGLREFQVAEFDDYDDFGNYDDALDEVNGSDEFDYGEPGGED